MNKVKNSWLNLIALLVLALFAANAAQKKRTPVYHSTLDSAAAIETPAVGATGVCWNVEFREGVKGNALYVPAGTSTVKVPFNDGLPARAGCVEFWAKILASNSSFTIGGNPRFFNFTTPGTDASSLAFLEINANNGSARGGWHLVFSEVWQTTGYMVYNSYPQIFGDLDYADWHHYVLKWNVDGLATASDKAFVFELDGNTMLSQEKEGLDVDKFCATLSQPLELLLPLQFNTRVPGDCRVPYLIDEFKVWDSDVIGGEEPEQPQTEPLYCVIDLSGGTAAESYPVTYLDAAPAGGWSDEYKTNKIVLRRIDPGTYTQTDSMGSDLAPELQRSRTTTISKAFYIGVFELTQAQYQNITGENPSRYKGDTRPVEYVSYFQLRGDWPGSLFPVTNTVDYLSFMGVMRARTGLPSIDIPTEAQWEYACRAGTTSAFNNGGDAESDLKLLGRYSGNRNDGNGEGEHAVVGSYQPNAWGLYDMHGNVWEWCLDWGDSELSTDPATDPRGAADGTRRALRGGSWDTSSEYCAAFARHSDYPNIRNNYGIRLMFPADDLKAISITPEPNPGTDPDPALDDGVDVVDGVTWYYTLDDSGNATIVKGAILYAGDLTTPQTLDGHPVKGIAKDGFIDCTGLTSIVVLDGVEYIGSGAFARCPSLVRAILPDSATNIVESCFYQCYSLAEYRIPQRLPFICRFFFHGTAIKKIDIPEGVARIGDNAFWLCEQLEEVTLPSTLTFIDWSAFHSCPMLKRIEFPECFEGFGVWTLKDEAHAAFGNCTGLEEAIFNGPLPTNFTYSWLDKLGCKIWYPKAYEASWTGAVPAEKFGGYTEDYGNEPGPGPDDPSLNDGVDVVDGVTWYYTLADGVATIVKGAILYAGDLTTPTTLDGHPVKAIGENAFRACPDLVSVVVSDGVETVGKRALSEDPILVCVTMPDSVTFIGIDAFYSSPKLSQMNLPPHVTTVSPFTFHETAITEIVIPEGVTTIGDCAFWQCEQLEEVTLPSTLTFMDWGAFHTCPSLKRIEFPEGFTGFGVWTLKDETHAAFGGCTGLEEAIFNGPLPANFTYSWLDKLGCKIWYPKAYAESWAGAVPAEKFGGYTEDYGKEPGPDDPDPNLNDGVDVVDGVTWYYTLADGVATIVKGATAYAGNPTTPIMLDGNPVKAIGVNAFRACPDLVTVVVSDGVESIGNAAFADCPLLTSVTLPDSVTFIDQGCFYASTKLAQINLPPHITSVNRFSFHDTALTEIVIPEGVTMIGDNTFWPCTKLESVTLPSTLTFIDWAAFNTCSALKRIEFPEGFERFGAFQPIDEAHAAFGNCTGLEEAIFNGPLPTNFAYSWLDKLGCKIWYPKAYAESWAGAVPVEKFAGYTEDLDQEIEFKPLSWGGYDVGLDIEPIAVTYNGEAENVKITLAGLPKGLAFKNGVISGAPANPGIYTVTAKVASGRQAVAERVVEFRVKNYTDPLAAGLEDAYGPFIPGVAVDLALDAVKGWKTSGSLPAGLKFTSATGRLAGVPTKPGVYTICFTRAVGIAVHAASATFTIAPLRRVVVEQEGEGTVKGAGSYLANAKAKLSAKPAKGMAVEGWYMEGERISRDAAFTYVVGEDEEQVFTVKYVSVADDLSSLACTMDGEAVASGDSITVTNYQGVAFSMPVVIDSLTNPKVTVSGLPKGLVYKDGVIEGAPKTASKSGKNGYTATKTTFTVKTGAGNSAKYMINFVTLPRPAWAVGTFDGVCYIEGEPSGSATLTVAADGTVSGKAQITRSWPAYIETETGPVAFVASESYTERLSAVHIKAYDAERDAFAMEVTVEADGQTIPRTRVFTLVQGDDGIGIVVIPGTVNGVQLAQNVWKRTDLKAPTFPSGKKALICELANGLVLKFGAKGAVTYAGKLEGDDGEPVDVSGSAQLIACWDEESGANAKLVIYVASKTGLTNGLCCEVKLRIAIDAKNVATVVEEVRD